MQFKRIAVAPLTPLPAPVVVLPIPTVGEVMTQRVEKFPPQNPTLGTDKPGEVTLLYNDSDTGIGYKEWATWCQGLTVVTTWGRCGNKLQRNYKLCRSAREAQQTMDAAIAQKRARGYRSHP